MRYFISQTMRNRTDDEIENERAEIIDAIRKDDPDAVIIDSFFKGCPHDAKPLWFLGKAFELLSTTDIFVFHPDIFIDEGSKGCLMEYQACARYGIEIRMFDPEKMVIVDTETGPIQSAD